MKASEKEMMTYLHDAITENISLRDFSYDIGVYLLDVDQLAKDNPELEDYLQDVMPEYAETYRNDAMFLPGLKKIYEHAKTLVVEE